jgi:hypothetical protein
VTARLSVPQAVGGDLVHRDDHVLHPVPAPACGQQQRLDLPVQVAEVPDLRDGQRRLDLGDGRAAGIGQPEELGWVGVGGVPFLHPLRDVVDPRLQESFKDRRRSASGSAYGTAMGTSVGRTAALRLTVIRGGMHL